MATIAKDGRSNNSSSHDDDENNDGDDQTNTNLSDAEVQQFTWQMVYSYFTTGRCSQVVKHQIDSYNDFVMRKMEQIIEGFNPIEIYHQYAPEHEAFRYVLTVTMDNVVVAKPLIYEKDGSTKIMMPNDARLRNLTYAAPVSVDVNIIAKTLDPDTCTYVSETKKISNVSLGRVPVMIRSRYCMLTQQAVPVAGDECRYDYGGYFIINGNEKVVISQDRIAENKTYVFVNNKASAYSHIAEIRSVQENRFGVPKTTSLKLSSKANQFGRYVRVNIHHIKHDIPLFVVFRALGIESDKDVVRFIVYSVDGIDTQMIVRELVGSMDEASHVRTAREAMEYLARYMHTNGQPREYVNSQSHRMAILKQILKKEFLPHVGMDPSKKALYLGYMVSKLLRCYLGLWEFDDRDSYINKRVDTPGVLLANLFRQYYGKVVKDMKNLVQKDLNTGSWRATGKLSNVLTKNNVHKIIKPTVIESGLKYGLATGNWGVKNSRMRQGVAQVLNRLTYVSTVSHLRRINTPIEKTGKLVQPRKLHPTQWGVICPSECFDPKTPILTWKGAIKEAKDITVGDLLIDDGGNAVRVKSTCSGLKRMYDVVPDKDNFMSYTVTDNHILTLKVKKNNNNVRFDRPELRHISKEFDGDIDNEDNDVIDITIEKYLSLPLSVQTDMYIFKSAGINWEEKAVALDPYILGMWLGDGLSSGYGFVAAHKELLDKWLKWGADNDATIKKGRGYKYGIINNSSVNNKTEQAPLKKLLAMYGLIRNKHIPMDYLVNDRKTRLAVLAGLVDTKGSVRAKGHEVRITQGEKKYRLLYDAEFLARSLGFACHMHDGVCTYAVKGEKRQKPYKELTIGGVRLYEIPTALPRKKLNRYDDPAMEKRCDGFLQSSFKLVEKDVQPFVGWQVEGSGRFLLGDMSVTHNTPEGASVGLVKNLATMASITIASPSDGVRGNLESLGVTLFDGNPTIMHRRTKVFVNGDLVGVHEDPAQLFLDLKRMKRSGVFNPQTSVSWNIFREEVSVCTEGGRCVRPLYIVDWDEERQACIPRVQSRRVLGMDWNSLVLGARGYDGHGSDDSIIEFLDVEECNTSMVAMRYADVFKGAKGFLRPVRFTHLEIEPCTMLGVVAGSIPFSDHNQAPRNTYQSAMAKQAIGLYAASFKYRYDTMSHVLTYPQKPLVSTLTARIINCEKLPCGINAVVAIACYTGFNQEDSVIMNRSAVERGLFISTFYRTYREQCNKNHSTGEEEFFCKPDGGNTRAMKPYNYAKLHHSGFVPENSLVDTGDIIIGKCMPQKIGTSLQNKDTSVVLKANERGFIDRNCYGDRYFTNTNGDGYTFAKVKTLNRGTNICDPTSTTYCRQHTQTHTLSVSLSLYNDMYNI
jgi:DNA-directed RNA polymerase beta subunit